MGCLSLYSPILFPLCRTKRLRARRTHRQNTSKNTGYPSVCVAWHACLCRNMDPDVAMRGIQLHRLGRTRAPQLLPPLPAPICQPPLRWVLQEVLPALGRWARVPTPISFTGEHTWLLGQTTLAVSPALGRSPQVGMEKVGGSLAASHHHGTKHRVLPMGSLSRELC